MVRNRALLGVETLEDRLALDGTLVCVPAQIQVRHGDSELTVTPVISADRRFVRLDLQPVLIPLATSPLPATPPTPTGWNVNDFDQAGGGLDFDPVDGTQPKKAPRTPLTRPCSARSPTWSICSRTSGMEGKATP